MEVNKVLNKNDDGFCDDSGVVIFGEFWVWGKNKRPKPKRLGAHITYILCLAGLAWLDGLSKLISQKPKVFHAKAYSKNSYKFAQAHTKKCETMAAIATKAAMIKPVKVLFCLVLASAS